MRSLPLHSLAQLQQAFQRQVLTPDTDFADHIVGTARVDAATRVGVYTEAYRLRLIEALETDYPTLKRVLGDADFDALARAYIDQFPSEHYSIRYFGRHLPHLLRARPPYRDNTLLTELAAFEWAMTDAFDAPDVTPVGVEDLAQVAPCDWPGLTFTLHPSAQRLDLTWNVAALWHAQEADQPLPPPEAAPYPLGWVVWRQGLQIYFRSLSVDQAWALDALRQGQSFAELCEGLCGWIDAQHVAAHAAGLLRQWLGDGLIAAIRLPPNA
jgi:hypothetical protein